MSAESDLYATLSAYAPLTAIVGARIYPDAMPEEGAYPAVVYVRTATEPIATIHGGMAGEFATLQIGCWGNTRAAADAAAEAVIDALLVAGEVFSGRSAGFDPETGLYATTIDITLLAV